MIVGVPKEIKKDEHRAALSPGAVEALVSAGHTVLVEKGAGLGAGIADREYREAGGRVTPAAAEVWRRSQMVVKVKEPLKAEYALMREGQTLFAFLHLAAAQPLARVLVRKRVRAIAFETVRTANGALPLLQPMSEIAGRMAVQEGAKYLEKSM
ncbi:MAG: alanine dehydrogenase, partial [Candidatus Tectomicrobia bacterium]|nr:alanine dehydrogenase [Candidatus Tectomicrobia bacterium]